MTLSDHLLNRDMELACDEGVLHRFGEQSRAGYAMSLIRMEEKKRYRILIPRDGWQLYAPDAWMWTANEQIQFWVNDCGGSTWNQVISRLQENGCSQTEEEGILKKEADGRIFYAEIRKSGLSTMCVHYTYPSDSEHMEGFCTLLRTIAATFTIVPEETDSQLSENYDQDIEVFPDGQDGHVAAEAEFLALKGWDEDGSSLGDSREISPLGTPHDI